MFKPLLHDIKTHLAWLSNLLVSSAYEVSLSKMGRMLSCSLSITDDKEMEARKDVNLYLAFS